MSIQGNVNQGVNMATILYRLSPEYEHKVQRKQTIKGMKEDVKFLKELQKSNTKAIKATAETTNTLAERAPFVSEEKLNEWKDKMSDIRELADKRIQSAETLLDNIYEARIDLYGKDLSQLEKAKVSSYIKDFEENYKEFKASSRDYEKAMGEYDEAIKKDELEREQRAKEKAEGIVHKEELDWDTDFDEDGAYVSRINKENAPADVSVKENLSTTEEEDTPVQESYETSPAKEDLSPAGKEVQRILAEDRAAESVMRAQQRQQRHAYMMDRARKMLNNQYDSGEISPYEWDNAMTENGLWGGNR